MLRELRVSEMRYRAVLEVLDGAVISGVARQYGVSRQTVHAWLRRYARDGAVLNLEDRSSRPHGCPHQMAPALEAQVLVLRDAHPRWGPTRIVYELAREGVVAVPGRSSVYRALVRNGRIDPARRRRRRRGLHALGAGPADGVVADGGGRRGSPGGWNRGQGGDRHR
jgi:transposase